MQRSTKYLSGVQKRKCNLVNGDNASRQYIEIGFQRIIVCVVALTDRRRASFVRSFVLNRSFIVRCSFVRSFVLSCLRCEHCPQDVVSGALQLSVVRSLFVVASVVVGSVVVVAIVVVVRCHSLWLLSISGGGRCWDGCSRAKRRCCGDAVGGIAVCGCRLRRHFVSVATVALFAVSVAVDLFSAPHKFPRATFSFVAQPCRRWSP